MEVINARNVNQALPLGIELLNTYGVRRKSRNGPVIEMPCSVATVYAAPEEMVLLNRRRNCNHFFHFFEALWILAGQNDVQFLAQFNPRMREYSDDGKTFNAAYGQRITSAYGFNQIQQVIKNLAADPDSRQQLVQLWHPNHDLQRAVTRDRACNLSILFKVRDGLLYMTVYNRSNDMLWGAYGANVVQFATLQKYVANSLGIKVGTYTQVSDSFHVYTEGDSGELWEKLLADDGADTGYPSLPAPEMTPGAEAFYFDLDLNNFFNNYEKNKTLLSCAVGVTYTTCYFKDVVVPMVMAWETRKLRKQDVPGSYRSLVQYVEKVADPAWRLGIKQWLQNSNAI